MTSDAQRSLARSRVPAIVLAAGLSSRMGLFKPLLALGGRPLIHRVIDALVGSGGIPEVVVVTGHRSAELKLALEGTPGVRAVDNPNFAAGEMLSSLRAGIAALEHAEKPAGFLLAFADQPAVKPETIAKVIGSFSAAEGAPLAIPTHRGKRGHPIVLSWDLVAEIRGLPLDDTLRTVVHRHLSRAVTVEVDDASILEDLDTPDDFERARRRYGN